MSLAFTYSALERVTPFDRLLKAIQKRQKKKSIHCNSAWSGAMTGSGLRGWFGLSATLFFTSPNHLDDWWRCRCFWCISCFSGEVVYLSIYLFISKLLSPFILTFRSFFFFFFLPFNSIWFLLRCVYVCPSDDLGLSYSTISQWKVVDRIYWYWGLWRNGRFSLFDWA